MSTDLEPRLADIWRRVLPARDDDFIAAGGDRRDALALAFEIRGEFGVDLSFAEFFAEPTLARLTAMTLRARSGHDGTRPPELLAVPAREAAPFPLTGPQRAHWLGRLPAFDLGGAGTHHYLEADLDDLDQDRYTRAWRQLIERHGMLRALVTAEGEQRVLPRELAYEPRMEDLRSLTAAKRTERLEGIRTEMRTQTMSPDRWPLFEVRISQLEQRRSRVHVSVDLLIADVDSMAILGADLAELYHGEPDSRSPRPAFGDVVRWTLAQARPPLIDQAAAYWDQRVGGLPPAPQPPLVVEPQSLEGPLTVRRRRRLSARHWNQLRAHARAGGLTPSATLACALGQSLGAWCKESRFTLAGIRSDRLPAHERINEVVGDFTQLDVLDVDADPRTSFRRRAQALQRQGWEALDHRHLDGIGILRRLARSAGQPTAATTPVVFSDRLGPQRPGDFSGWALGQGGVGFTSVESPQVWLAHEVSEEAGELVVTWDVIDAVFPAALIGDLVDNHVELLRQLADDPEAWEAPARECLPQAQRLVREHVNATAAPLEPLLLHEPFWEQARRTPDEPAVIAEERTLTYRELRAGATALGARLRELGARPNQVVAIVMDKGWQQPLAVFGILESGAAYVPVEPDLPEERFRYLLQHAEVELALVQPHLADTMPWPPGVRPIVVDETLLSGEGALEPSRIQGQRDLAYIIYTSGSTGQPKGVMIDHRGALNTVLDINRRFDVGPGDRVLSLTPLSFDLSVYDLFGPFGCGGAIVMPDPGTGRAPWHWADLIERHGVTLWNTVPALMEMLVGYTLGRRQRLAETLRLVLMSGDWIPVSLPGRIRALAAPDIDVISLGGATEASIWSIWHRIGEVDPALPSIPYGTPLANQSLHILDEALHRRPDWVPGEQYVGGFGVAMGYWRDEEKTRRAFVRHPVTGDRLYRTGDLGRHFPDGAIEFLGREDFQIKVHGYRIELGEIEAALLAHESITATVVTAIGEQRGDKRLVAYVTTDGGSSGGSSGSTSGSTSGGADELAAGLREHLAGKLPPYMVPAHIVVLDALPLTRNGKVDRKALPAPMAAVGGAAPEPTGPADDLEAGLAAIWREVLGHDDIGATDDYFALGADSLHVVRAHHRIAQRLAPHLGLDAMFRHRGIRALARHLSTTDGRSRGDRNV